MSEFPGGPRLIKGGIALLNPVTGVLERMIALQYNPETLTRTLLPQALGPDSGDRLEALRLKGPPVETLKLDAQLDATDQLEFPDANPGVLDVGLHPQLAALEMLVYPSSAHLQSNFALAAAGTLEIAPAVGPLTLFVWSSKRVVPVRVTDFSIVEEAFDAGLNPIMAKVSLGMRVLSVSDLSFDGKGGSLYMIYQQQKEKLAARSRSVAPGVLGLQGPP